LRREQKMVAIYLILLGSVEVCLNTEQTREFIRKVCRGKPETSEEGALLGLSTRANIKCLDDQLEELIFENITDTRVSPKLLKTLSVGDAFGGLSETANGFFYISHSAVEIGIITESVPSKFVLLKLVSVKISSH
jgi:hypothetical protein